MQRDDDIERLSTAFDHLDPAMGADVLDQVYERLLAGCPVAKTAAHGGYAVVSRHADVIHVEKTPEVFSSASGVLHPPHAERAPSIPIEFDAPLHPAYRALFMDVLSAPRVRTLEPYLRELTDRLLDDYLAGDDDDFVQHVAVQLPIRAVGTLIGFGEEANDQMQAFATQILENFGTPKMIEAMHELGALGAAHLADRRAEPRDDYLTTLAQAEVDGRPLRDDELLNILRTFAFAGFETTAHAIASLVHHLAVDQELQERLRSDASMIGSVVEEGLRMFPPVHTMFRTVTQPATLHDVAFEPGDRLAVLYAAANRDPAQFENADVFCPERANSRQHLAFGIGPHYCAGAPLARAEMRILLEALVARPPFRLAGTPKHLPHLMMGQMMGVDYLPLTFTGK
jgi:cytochrome P450